jgi:hypothetical protein
MRRQITFLLTLTICLTASNLVVIGQQLERLSYNNPGLLVDLGVGLWAWPLPMDYNDNGLTDLVVVCTDTPYNGIYFFENSGIKDEKTDLPVFKPAKRLGDAINNVGISYIGGEPILTTPGKWYPNFKNSAFEKPVNISAPDGKNIDPHGRIRANQWQFVDFNNNGVKDLIVGIGVWGDRDYKGREYYGWDDAYNEKGQWTNGPLHGYIYLIENEGSNEKPKYKEPIQLLNTDGVPLNVYGRPSPNFADFNGDGKPDLICGEFRDGFTFFENVGSKKNPLFSPGRPLTNGDQIIRMDLCMITPVAYDFTGNGWPDLIVGDEDGRVALVEHTGKVVDGMPVFLPPRYFKQKADKIKFGALATPVGYDWNGDGLDDIIVGNTAGHIAFIENLGGKPAKWAAPELLKADGEIIRIMAGPNGSIQGSAEAKWGYTTLTVADWNHNGLPDLIVNSIWGKVIWYENIGSIKKPKLTVAKPIEVEWKGKNPKPEWNWWNPSENELVTQWRTTPVAIDWTGNGLTDLVMLDHEGYLSLYRREIQDDKLVLLPGERIFRLKGEEGPLRLNEGKAGRSGRRKISVVDFDSDGRLDLLLNSQNASFYRNISEENGITIFEDLGLLDERRLAGHTSSPTTITLTGDGTKDLLIGAEDGYLYYKQNPYEKSVNVKHK